VLSELEQAETKWQKGKTVAYEFRVEYACNALIPVTPPDAPRGMLFRVTDGKSTFLRSDVSAEAVHPDLVPYSTVEHLFAFIRKAASRPAQITVRYDDALGYPTRVCVDPIYERGVVADDEYGFAVTHFEALSKNGGNSIQ
jgi:hypothetical protein